MEANAHNADYTRTYNRKQFLSLLRRAPHSRADVAHALGLTRAATTLIADEFIREGFILETEAVSALRGRPPKPLVLSGDAAYAIGVYLNRDGYQAGLVDFTDKVVAKLALRFDANTGTDKTALLLETLRALIRDAGVPDGKIVGAGISCPGPIDGVRGRILNVPRFRLWANSDLAGNLRKSLGVPVFLEKDAACFAQYNIEKGLAKDSKSFLLYLIEGGVGSGVVSDGVLLKSPGGFTPELGHCSIDHRGKPCECGNIGCLESYASISNLLAGSPYASWEELILACEQDENARALLRKEAEYLAAGAVTAANLWDIDTVLLAGTVRFGAEKLAPLMEEILNARRIRRGGSPIRVGNAFSAPDHEIIAASEIAFDHYLSV